MDNKDQPAFPAMDMNNYNGHEVLELRYKGLTKREYFAAMAMQGLTVYGGEIKVICKQSVQLADELIKQLNNAAVDSSN